MNRLFLRFPVLTDPRLLLLLAVYLFLPKTLREVASTSVDDSWQYSLTFAVENRLWFGTEWAFTYGPLGFLITRAVTPGLLPYLILFDALGLVLFVLTARRLWFMLPEARRVPSAWLGLGLLFLAAFVRQSEYLLFEWFLVYLFLFVTQRRPADLALAFVLVVVQFFGKLNFGLTSALFLFFACGLAVVFGKFSTLRMLLFWVMGLAGLVLAAWGLHVDLPGYLQTARYFLRDYPDTMTRLGFAPLWAGLLLSGAAAVLLVYGTLGLRHVRSLLGHWPDAAVYALTGGALLIFYRQSFTRFDWLHVLPFFGNAALVAGLGLVFLKNPVLLASSRRVMLSLAALCALGTAGLVGVRKKHVFNPIGLPYADLYTPKQRAQRSQQRTDYDRLRLPEKALNQLQHVEREGFSPDTTLVTAHAEAPRFDVFPHNLLLLPANGLGYTPRPTVQSYAACGPELARLNEQHYLSAQAPDYVLVEENQTGFNERNTFWDDGPARLALLRRYAYLSGDSLLVLRRRADIRPLMFRNRSPQSAVLGRALPVPAGPGLLWLKAQPRYTAMGQTQKLFFQAPSLYLELRFTDGRRETFRSSLPQLRGGILLTSLRNGPEARRFYASGGREAPRVKQVRFVGWEFERDIPVQVAELDFTAPPQLATRLESSVVK